MDSRSRRAADRGRRGDHDGPLGLGQLLPGTDFLEVLGYGSATVVYRVRRGGRDYAAKVLATVTDVQEQVSFRREAALLASLDHPGVVSVHEVGDVAGRPYLIMDLVTGQTLADVLRDNGPLEPAHALAIGSDVAGALAVAHRAGLVHRDVKPENIMFDVDGRAQLIDFGLAIRSGSETGENAVGTFRYSAPEQTGVLRRAVDGRADLYALGAVLFESLAGRPPYLATDSGELISQHISAPVPDVRAECTGVTPAVGGIITKLLAKDPDDRYQTASSLVTDLQRILGGDPAAFALDRSHGLTAQLVDVDDQLVGRREELHLLAVRWRRALSGYGSAALVTGAAGSGKSRLAREVARAALTSPRPVLVGVCAADRYTPMDPFRVAIEGFLAAVQQMPEPGRSAAVARVGEAAGGDAAVLALLVPSFADVVTIEPAPDSAPQLDEERFASAVASFLANLARIEDGLMLYIDDVQFADEGTRRVLRALAPLLAGTPLLVLATAPDRGTAPDGDPEPASSAGFSADLGTALGLTVVLDPLGSADVEDLVAHQLSCPIIAPAMVARLVACGDGNPLAISEYVRAVLDAGLIRPSWGTWLLDEAGLDTLALPADITALLLRRVDGLGADARDLLTVAAAIGSQFHADLVGAAGHLDEATTLATLHDTVAHRLIEPTSAGGYTFLHDRIREVLLSALDGSARRRLHQRIAEELDRGGERGPTQVYALAHHYLRGETGSSPERAIEAARVAGTLALAEFAADEAIEVLAAASAVAGEYGIPLDTGFHAEFGVAASRLARYELADRHLAQALATETDPLHRAKLYDQLAETRCNRWMGDEAIELVRKGLAEVGSRLPRDGFPTVVSTLWSLVLWGVVTLLPARLRTVTGLQRKIYQQRIALGFTGSSAAAHSQRRLLMASFSLRSVHLVKRLGPGPENTTVMAGVAVMASAMGSPALGLRIIRRASAGFDVAADPGLAAHLEWLIAMVEDGVPPVRPDSGRRMRRMLELHGRWLTVGWWLAAVGAYGELQLSLGRLTEAAEWRRRAAERATDADGLLGTMIGTLGIEVSAMQGRPAEATAELDRVREFMRSNPGNKGNVVNVVLARMRLALEQGDTGPELDAAGAEFDAMGLRLSDLWPGQRTIFVWKSLGWLASAAAKPPGERAGSLARAESAVRELRRAAKGPVLRAYHGVAAASLLQLRDDNAGALRALAAVDAVVGSATVPLLGYEMERVRARAYLSSGEPAAARHHASVALLLATGHGWVARARWIRTEFGLDASAGVSRTRDGTATEAGIASTHHHRRLEALHQVSLAAANVLDPRELARVVLDEIVQIFGAERAFLFLREPDQDHLTPYLGRDANRTDLIELTGYGSTLVERVADSCEALVVTGTEHGEVYGSRSAQVHGLRSIMVAPLLLDSRLMGVVYLDSRVAKGIFATEDVEMLTVITNHIALSLGTARAAQLELAVHAAEGERNIAQTLHRSMSELTASLEPAEVGQRLVDTVAEVLPVDVAILLRPGSAGGLTVAAVATTGGGQVTLPTGPLDADLVSALLDADGHGGHTRTAALSALSRLLGVRARIWLTVPLVSRGEHCGLLLSGTDSDRPFSPAEAEVGAVLASQGMAALDNALLFQHIQDLASKDGLTGLYNRRHFDDIGGRLVADERRSVHPVTALMVDIDHFKRVNDTYGHGVGDEVIREVARRLSASFRQSDILCRYGGEEFAVLLTDVDRSLAERMARRAHAAIAGEPVLTQSGPLVVTVSIGVAGPPDTDLTTLLGDADKALYQAKRSGRNRVVQLSGAA